MYGWPATVGLPHTTVLAAPGTTLLGAKLRSPSRMMFITVVGGSARGGRAPNTEERLQRCEQLDGKLREDCLRDERSAAGGSTAPALGSPTTPRIGSDDRAPVEIRPSTK